jgi:hypothetical protein
MLGFSWLLCEAGKLAWHHPAPPRQCIKARHGDESPPQLFATRLSRLAFIARVRCFTYEKRVTQVLAIYIGPCLAVTPPKDGEIGRD